jgi:hypothetical protein
MLSGYVEPIVTKVSENPTSVTFSIVPHEFSLPTAHYMIALNRVTGNNQGMCKQNVDPHRLMIPTEELPNLVTISNLEELSAYHLEVEAHFNYFNEPVVRRVQMDYATPGAGKIATDQCTFFWKLAPYFKRCSSFHNGTGLSCLGGYNLFVRTPNCLQ